MAADHDGDGETLGLTDDDGAGDFDGAIDAEKVAEVAEVSAEDGGVRVHRVVCDYIAGMTDNYIYEQYEKHCGNVNVAATKTG